MFNKRVVLPFEVVELANFVGEELGELVAVVAEAVENIKL